MNLLHIPLVESSMTKFKTCCPTKFSKVRWMEAGDGLNNLHWFKWCAILCVTRSKSSFLITNEYNYESASIIIQNAIQGMLNTSESQLLHTTAFAARNNLTNNKPLRGLCTHFTVDYNSYSWTKVLIVLSIQQLLTCQAHYIYQNWSSSEEICDSLLMIEYAWWSVNELG